MCVYTDTVATGTKLRTASTGDSDPEIKRQTGHGQVPVRHGSLNEVGICLLLQAILSMIYLNGSILRINFMVFSRMYYNDNCNQTRHNG